MNGVVGFLNEQSGVKRLVEGPMEAFFSRASLVAAALALTALGCGGSTAGGFDAGGDGGSPGMDATRMGDSHVMADVPMLGEASSGDGGGVTYQCSADLQSVINAMGVVVAKCPPDQGCAGGKCVAACDAAAANKGTLGCDFQVATPAFYPSIAPPCFAVFIANNWGKSVTVKVTRGGTSYNVSSFGVIPVAGAAESTWSHITSAGVPAGDVGILFLDQDPSSINGSSPLTCPITPAVNQAGGTAVYTGGPSTGIGTAWHIETDVPVTAYDIIPYGGAQSFLTGAELLIPTTAWSTNYYGIVPLRGSAPASLGPQYGQIVGTESGTTVKIVPNVPLPGGTGVAPAPASAVTTYLLNAGEYIQWEDSGEMSSTIISSNKPIGFFGGIGYDCYSSLTSSGGGCDSAHQQIPPIKALGSDYVAPPFATRMASLEPESIPYRIVGVVNGTKLTYDPPVTGAPTTLSAGQVVSFETILAFEVKSQDANHPFYVGQIMPGCEVNGGGRPGCGAAYGYGSCCLGDEEYVNIFPPAQFLQKYVFFTDVTYATTNLVFTRVKGPAGFADVVLDCAGKLSGWTPVGTSGNYEITNIDLIRAGKPNGTCNNGPHTATSDAPFGLMVWGLDSFVSYAYPAGGNVAPINTVVVPPNPPK